MSASFDYRDYEAAPRSNRFTKYFRRLDKRTARHPHRNYGGRLADRSDGTLDRATALHWLLHHRDGSALVQRTGLPPDRLADLLVEAASRFDPDADPAEVSAAAEQLIDEAVAEEEDEETTNKKATNMAKEIGITEVCKAISSGEVDPPTEHALATAIKKHASAFAPTERERRGSLLADRLRPRRRRSSTAQGAATGARLLTSSQRVIASHSPAAAARSESAA